MKKLLFAVMMTFACTQAIAGPQDAANVRLTQNLDQSPSTGITTRYLFVPASGNTCAVILSGTTRLPHCYVLGAGLAVMNDTITATQVQADWNLSSGAGSILNKPSFANIAYTADWADLINKPATWAPSPHTHVSTDISDSWPVGRSVLTSPDAATARAALGAVASTDSRLSDARAPLAHTHVIADVTGLQTALNGKYNQPTGTTAQYLRGDGSLATLPASPTVPVINRARITTAADGTLAWTLPIACGSPPIVSITPESSTANDAVSHRIVSVTNTTVNVFAGRSPGLSVLGLTVLGVPGGAAIPLHLIAICP